MSHAVQQPRPDILTLDPLQHSLNTQIHTQQLTLHPHHILLGSAHSGHQLEGMTHVRVLGADVHSTRTWGGSREGTGWTRATDSFILTQHYYQFQADKVLVVAATAAAASIQL